MLFACINPISLSKKVTMKKIVSLILPLIVLCTCYHAYAQDSTYAREIIRTLSADDMYGRACAHDGDGLAANFLIRELSQLKTFGKSFKQSYHYKAFAMQGKISLTINDRLLVPAEEYLIAPFSRTVNQECGVVFVDPKLLLDEKKLNAFVEKNREKLAGAFVCIDMTKMEKKKEAERKPIEQAVRELNYVNPFRSLGILLNVTKLSGWSLGKTNYERPYAMILVKEYPKFKSIKKLSPSFHNELVDHETQNVVAYSKGTLYPDSFMVFTAHYDHLGCMGDSVIFHGAHDNASGCAAVLDIARHFAEHPAKYSVAVILFSGEEPGCFGSQYYVKHPLFPLSKIKCLVNLDLMCGGDDGITVVNAKAANTNAYYWKLLRLNERLHAVPMVKERENAKNSDHFPFVDAKVPAIFVYTMGGKTGPYHHWDDTCDNCGLERYEGIVNLFIKMVEGE